jgi:xanthine dehydrogenase accessory factor
VFSTRRRIGERVQSGEAVGSVAGVAVTARLDGILRGLIRPGTTVTAGLKLGDVDPRGEESYCDTISDKARAVAGGVLEAILGVFNV